MNFDLPVAGHVSECPRKVEWFGFVLHLSDIHILGRAPKNVWHLLEFQMAPILSYLFLASGGTF